MTELRKLERQLERQGAEIQLRSRHLLVLRDGRPITILPRSPSTKTRGRQHENALACLRRAGFTV